jgi:DNA repair exonuclease SbcCD ATPase subunit
MNLVRVNIENFKQYVEPVEIDIPSQATIGVIGTNGVGKTTLFQAIEWCLYNPGTIPGKEVRPRGRSGNPKVSVTLESQDGKQRWLIERELKRSSSTSASIYQIDQDGTESLVVQGTKDVTAYVTNHLIDLSHKAFVATFFTRQKELHFFGDIKDTDRRREVGKLLGLETIRQAQKSIGEDRNLATNAARVLREQYESEIRDRDLDAEAVEAEEQVKAAHCAHQQASAAVIQAVEQTTTAKKHFETVQASRDRFNEVQGRLDRARQDQANTDKQHRVRLDEIVRLQDCQIQREQLLPVAAQREELETRVRAAEVERERYRARLDLERNLQANRSSRSETITIIEREVSGVQIHQSLTQWHWTINDHRDVRGAYARLDQVASGWPADTLEQRVNHLRHAQRTTEQARQAEDLLRKYHKRRAELMSQREQLIAGNDPDQILRSIAYQRSAIMEEIGAINAARERLTADVNKGRRLLANLERADFNEGCPTCGQPFSRDAAEFTVKALRRQIEELQAEVKQGEATATSHNQRLSRLIADQAEEEARQQKLRELDARISKSVGVIDEQEAIVEQALREVEAALTAAGIAAAPQPDDIERAGADLLVARQVHQALDRISIHVGNVEKLDSDKSQIEASLGPLRDARFDEPAYQALVKLRNDAITAQTRIEGFDRELLQLPKAIADRDDLAAQLEALSKSIACLEKERAAVGFDPAQLSLATECVKQAETNERNAIAAERSRELVLQQSEFARKQKADEHQRIRQKIKDADARQHEADDLSLMYTLFGEFEQFVVSHLTPALSDLTSELVRQVTDGKYDDVSFDDNFGIQVADGEDIPFPLATFSGGERDAIALCARLALSQMIGQQSADQPGFLVLDEVFGSLDRDRRTRLLELFGSLSSISDRFQQVFIISHVDDVRTAPILDELWLVSENDQGMSSIASLTPGSDIGEL